MRLNVALLVSLLLSVTLAGAFAPVSAVADQTQASPEPRMVSLNHTANHVTIPDGSVERSGHAGDGLALGTAIAADAYSLQAHHERLTFERSFDRAETEANKTAVIRSVADRVDRQTQHLEHRNRDLIRGYANGTISTERFLRERAQIHHRAARLQDTVQRVDTVARSDDNYSPSTVLRTRLADLGGGLEVLQGPVSERTGQAASGSAPGASLYAEASTTGYTVAYVQNDTYVRESYVASERDPGVEDSFADADVPRGSAARLRSYELYPWVPNNSVSPTVQGLGESSIYRFSADFTDGELVAYLDGGTTDVFREHQRHKLSTMPFSESVSNTNESLRVRVNATYETGPMEVTVIENGTDSPTDASVTIDGEPVGETGDDGTLWVIEPSDPITVNATTGRNETVSVSLPARS